LNNLTIANRRSFRSDQQNRTIPCNSLQLAPHSPTLRCKTINIKDINIKDRHFLKSPNQLPGKHRFQKIVSNFRFKVEFELKNRFLGIVARIEECLSISIFMLG
jgi:hypothetical protein